MPPRRYLDHPATSWPKPGAVVEAVTGALEDLGGAAGRGTHAAARAADAIRGRARAAAARVLGREPARVALVPGATFGLNVAIHGLVRPGWHVIATAADHNATLRPLATLAARGVIALDVVPCDSRGRVDPDDVARAWRPATRAVVFSHASNVTGTLQDADAIVDIARRRDGITVLDASQTAAVVPLPAAADVVVAPGHKWWQGPPGIACLAVRGGLEPDELVQGGTGTASESLSMPESFVERMEAGTPDLGALAGLLAATAWLEHHGAAAIAAHGRRLAGLCRDGLRALDGVRVVGDGGGGPPIVAFTVEGYDPAEVSGLLEQLAGVEARSGFHCAALVHPCLGTAGTGGAVRVGFGPFNVDADALAVVAAVAAILGRPEPALPAPASPPQVPPWQT